MDSSGGSRHPDHEISGGVRGEGGGGGLGGPKIFSQPFVHKFSVTIRGGRGPLGSSLDSQYMHNFKTRSTKGMNGN